MSRRSSRVRPAPLGSSAWCVVALLVATGCGSSAGDATGAICAELYGQGLTGCTEHCRPFGVLHFGVEGFADGTFLWTCECMPGSPPDQQERRLEPDGRCAEPLQCAGRTEPIVAAGPTTPDVAVGSFREPEPAGEDSPSTAVTTRL